MRRKSGSRIPNPAALPWQRARQGVQLAVLAFFLALLLLTRGGEFPDVPPSLFFQFDPLAMLASLISARQWLTGLGLALVTIGVTVVAGRVWCGWICPLGTLLDLFRWRPRRAGGSLEHWRKVKYVALLLLLGAALAGNLTLLIFDPISILTRGFASFLFPAANQASLALERLLYDTPWLQSSLDTFESAVRTPLFPADVWRWWNLLPGLLLVAVISLNLVRERFWCRYLCPLGALLGLVSRIAILRRVVGEDACRSCQRCVRACPTGTIHPKHNFASDPAECIVCLDCLPECPTPQGQTFALPWTLAPMQTYDPGRRQALAALGLGLVAALVYPLVPIQLRRNLRLIRPPGAQQNEKFLSMCIRCSECLKVCPTSGLQPALPETRPDGLWTPTLVPRLGYCDYACHSCGQVCPTGAIPNLTLEAKRAVKIGTAEVNQELCLPWSQNTPCIVCEEMCPLSPKAIELDTVSVTDSTGLEVDLQRPRVLYDRCIGCGICEYKCPLDGEAAIRVTDRV
jgi:polyferredoxin